MYLNHLTAILFLICLSVTSRAQTKEAFTEKEALTKARTIYKQLKQGESFEKMAMLHSHDLASAKAGGDLGFAKPGQMVEPFEKAALALKAGEISRPVRSEFGYHIIQLLEKEEKGYWSRHILIQVQ